MRVSMILLLLAAASGLHPASGQGLLPIPISLELRLGGGIPTGDFADREPGVEAETGPSVGAGVAVHISPWLAVLGGYGRTGFSCPRCGEQGIESRVVDEGADFGFHLALPVRLRGVEPWVRAGGVYHQLSFSGLQAKLVSEPALGFQVGGGIVVPLRWGFRLTPGLQFRTYSAELDLGGLPGETVDVSHALVDVGLSYRF